MLAVVADGGQLLSLEKQSEYDVLVDLINDSTEFVGGAGGGGATEHWLLGLHSDGRGNWEYTDGTTANMAFLNAHASGLSGTTETNMVFSPDTNTGGFGAAGGGLHDCCNAWSIDGFVCEFYAAPVRCPGLQFGTTAAVTTR